MEGARFIEKLRLKNLLSFGSEGMELALEPLNVLIGPIGSGKSNLIEVLGLAEIGTTDIAAAIRRGGGIGDWLWKGSEEPPIAEFDVTLRYNLPRILARSVTSCTSPQPVLACKFCARC